MTKITLRNLTEIHVATLTQLIESSYHVPELDEELELKGTITISPNKTNGLEEDVQIKLYQPKPVEFYYKGEPEESIEKGSA